MRVLVTGGSGFLGSALALHLQAAGHEVSVLLRSTSSLQRLESAPAGLSVCRIDTLHDLSPVFARIRPEAVIHTACNYGRHGEPMHEIAAANTGFSLAVLEAATKASTALFINTDTVLDRFTNPYALSKKQFSEWGAWFGRQQKLRFINVLLQHMYGAGDDASKFTSHVIRSCHTNQPSLALTPGQQQRDFIYIKDVVSAYACLLDRAVDLGWVADVEVGSGSAPTIEAFVRLVHRLTASVTRLDFGVAPYRPGEPMCCVADVSVLEKLGWAPHYSLERGIAETISLEFSK
jgi:CDP-paratose synthetase